MKSAIHPKIVVHPNILLLCLTFTIQTTQKRFTHCVFSNTAYMQLLIWNPLIWIKSGILILQALNLVLVAFTEVRLRMTWAEFEFGARPGSTGSFINLWYFWTRSLNVILESCFFRIPFINRFCQGFMLNREIRETQV